MKARFGLITDVHYAKYGKHPYVAAGGDWFAPGGGNHLRRFSTSKQRFSEAIDFFNEENQNRGLDFWFSLGDELDASLNAVGEGEERFQEYITDSRGVEGVPFYLTQGHHTQYSFDRKFLGGVTTYTWDDYYNILFHPTTGNGGIVENAFPGDTGYPYAGGWDGTSGDYHWPLSYTFTKNGIKFIVYTRYFGGTDKIDGWYEGGQVNPSVGGHKQWLRDQLDVDMPVIIFSHCHIWINDDNYLVPNIFLINDWDTRFGVSEEDTIKYILENAQANIIGVFSGHWHEGKTSMKLNGIKYFAMKGSIRTSYVPGEYDETPASWMKPMRAEGASENAYYLIEIDENNEVYITGYGYNGKILTTDNFERYPVDTTYNLAEGSTVEINNSRRFSLIDDILPQVFGGDDSAGNFKEVDATLIIDGETYSVGSFIDTSKSYSIDDIGKFVWEKNSSNAYIFQSEEGSEGENITFTHPNGKLIKITWEGKGSHQFLVEIISGETTSTSLDAHPITYYKAKMGESELSEDQWYLNYNKKHAFKIYSDFDPIEDL